MVSSQFGALTNRKSPRFTACQYNEGFSVGIFSYASSGNNSAI